MSFSSSEKTFAKIARGTTEIIQHEELQKLLCSGRRLRIKVGFDPTAPDLHLGHTVILQKMRQFQQLGHEVIFLIGDYTGLIGDPTGKNITRKPLSHEELRRNAKTYSDQVFKILDRDATTIAFNSAWMSNLNSTEFIRLAAKYNLARILEREDFAQRYRNGSAIALHELLYPLIQAYDSVALKADIELGGTDQKFNLLVGRDIQRAYGQNPQVIITLPLLEGLDGVQKMSKSLNNYIALYDSPNEMFGKVMSLSDTIMWRYFTLLSDLSNTQIEELKQDVVRGFNPRDVKMQLAHELVARFHDHGAANRARDAFEAQFSQGELPSDTPCFRLHATDDLRLTAVLQRTKLVTSQSAARRLMAQRAITLDGIKIEDPHYSLQLPLDVVVQVGKRRFIRLNG